MRMWLWLALANVSAEPPGSLSGVAMAPGAAARYRDQRRRRGMSPDSLVCDSIARGWVEVCYQRREPPGLTWIHPDAMGGLDRAKRAQWLEMEAQTKLAAVSLTPVGGMPHRYLALIDRSGVAASLLHPDRIADRVGGVPVRIAVPSRSVLVAYRAADSDLDRVVAVAVREIQQALPHPLSPDIFEWNGREWRRFGRAEPRGSE